MREIVAFTDAKVAKSSRIGSNLFYQVRLPKFIG